MINKITTFLIALLLLIPNSTKAENGLSDFLKDYFNVDISWWPIDNNIPVDSVFSDEIGDFHEYIRVRTLQIEILDDYLKTIRRNFLENMDSIFNAQRDFQDDPNLEVHCKLIEERNTEQLFRDAIGYETLHLPLAPEYINEINDDDPYEEIANIAELEKIDYLTYRGVLQYYKKYYFNPYGEQVLEDPDNNSDDFSVEDYPAVYQEKDIDEQKDIMAAYGIEVPGEVLSNSNWLELESRVGSLLDEEINTAYEAIILATKLDREESLAASMIEGICLMQVHVDDLRKKLAKLREGFVKLLPCVVARQCNAS